MRCYACDQADESMEAVAICIVCGMGVCRDHAVRQDVAVKGTLWYGQAPVKGPLPKAMMRILCDTCAQALAQTGAEEIHAEV